MSGGAGRGGRGALLQKLLEQQSRRPGTGEEERVVPPPSAGLGRAAKMAELMKKVRIASATTPAAVGLGPVGAAAGGSGDPGAAQPAHVGRPALGRGFGRGFVASVQVPTRTEPPVTIGRGFQSKPASLPDSQPVLSTNTSEPLSIHSSELAEPHTFRGEEGREVPVVANYIRLDVKQGCGIYEYHVSFNPQVDQKKMRYKLLYDQESLIGRARSFDGTKLYLPIKLEKPQTVLTACHPVDNSPITVYIKYIKQHRHPTCTHLYNVIFKRVMTYLKMSPVGRNYYDSKGGIPIPQYKLEIWPGYVTAVTEYEGGLMLTLDVSHKVLRNLNVLDILKELAITKPGTWKADAEKTLIGAIVMTKYNNRTYRIDELMWNLHPSDTFENHLGEVINYIDYYRKQHDIIIRDVEQPMILHRMKPPRGKTDVPAKLINLVPELCFMTGLTDDMRSNFQVMKSVAAHTRLTPNERQKSYMKFIQNVANNQQAQDHLSMWGLRLHNDMIQLSARVKPKEVIRLGKREVNINDKCDWTGDLTRENIFLAIPITNWSILFVRNNEKAIEEFLQTMLRVCPAMGIMVSQPRRVMLKDDRTDTYVRAITDEVNQGGRRCQIIVTVCPTSRDDRYSAIKKRCYLELGMPNQVLNARTISDGRKLRSVTQKVALQMNCKLGGELWAVKIPLQKLMVCGIDVYHDVSKRGRSVVGFVGSLNASITRWFSKVCFQSTHMELVDGLKTCMVAALQQYHEINHDWPNRIVLFRDGVSDGQMKTVIDFEIEQIASSFAAFGTSFVPKLTVIICQKRINTRFFSKMNGGHLGNPDPGTVLDHTITRYDRYDFFLVSQQVNQGTVTPTHYVVVRDDSNFKPDHIQRLTYKMTHMYYNWPGTVRVPAPCQYAHKLAQMTGQHLHKEAAAVLCDKLFFL